MNIATLNKYWKELEHFKNGGSLQARIWISDPNDGDTCYSIWYEVGSEGWGIDKVFNYDLEYTKVQIIINDEYVEFRKALAEGKTVQFKPSLRALDLGYDFVDISRDVSDYNIELLRIKPEEPKFKVGDWVRDLRDNNVFQINSVNFNLNLSITNGVYIHWQPKPGEWCWFWNNSQHPFIAKFEKYGKNGLYCPQNFSATENCEPYIGKLPSILEYK